MAGRIILDLGNPSLDASGRVLAGATLTFYQNGTTTPQSIYTDSTLATPLENPLTADSAGRFPPIWADASEIYSVVWKTAAGSIIATFDDISPFGGAPTGLVLLADIAALQALIPPFTSNTAIFVNDGLRQGLFTWNASDLSAQVANDPLNGVYVVPSSDTTYGENGAWVRSSVGEQGYVTPEMFGAIGDWLANGIGAHDDRAAIQAAFNFLGTTSGVWKLKLPGNYRIGSFNPSPSTSVTNCLEFGTQNTIVEGCTQNAAFSYTDLTLNYMAVSAGQTADAFILFPNAITVKNVTFSTNVSGTPAQVFTNGMQWSTGNFTARGVMENFNLYMQNGTCLDGMGGIVWGSTWKDGIIAGAARHNVNIPASTSDTWINVYSNGSGQDGFYFEAPWYLNLVGCSADSAGAFGYHIGGDARSVTITNCGTEQPWQALKVENGSVTVAGFYFQVSDAGAAAAVPIIQTGGILTIMGLNHNNNYRPDPNFGTGTTVAVSGGIFNCLDASISPEEVTCTSNAVATINGSTLVYGSGAGFDYFGAFPYDFTHGGLRTWKFIAGAPIAAALSVGFRNPNVWASGTVVAAGAVYVPSAYNRYVYTCTTPGTTGGSEPSWPTSVGGTVNDNGVVWTASKYSSDQYGPLEGFYGTGSVGFGTTAGYTSFSSQAGMAIKNNGIPVVFRNTNFEFDINDASKSGFVVSNCPLIIFDGCTFEALSPMGALFDGFGASNVNNVATRVVVKANCKFKGLGFITPNNGNYLRTTALQPAWPYGNTSGEFVFLGGAASSGSFQNVPTDTYWDADIVVPRAGLTAGGYTGDACVRSGYAAKAVWSSGTPALGDTVVPVADNGHVYVCTTSGPTGGSEPSFATGSASTTTDGSAVWTEAGTSALFKASGAIAA